MKLLRFGAPEAERPGLLDATGNIRDLSGHVADIDGAMLANGGLSAIEALDPSTLPLVDPSERLSPCVGHVGKFICIGLNYADHAAPPTYLKPGDRMELGIQGLGVQKQKVVASP